MIKVFKENRLLSILIIGWYLGGISGFLTPQLKSIFQLLTPVGMVLSTFLLMYFHEPKNLKSALVFSFIILITFLAELIGVNTQRLFGHYQYGVALGMLVWETPVVIGLNWLILIYCFSTMARKWRDNWYFPLLGASAMVAFDWLMEPVAMATGMWRWEGGVVPLKNYTDWFLISGLLFLIIRIFKVEFNNRFAGLILLMQVVFFAVLNLLIRVI